MAEKILNTRIMLKYDTYANWVANNPVLKKGEAAVGTIESNADGVQNAPSVVVKIGDGTTAYNSLKFISGLAADVYSWAKAATKPEYTASEITGLSEYISGEIEDTDTQYQIVKVDDYNYKLQSKALDGAWADVTGSNIVIPAYDDTEVRGLISANTTAIDTIEADYLKAADKTALTTLINTAQGAADAAQADVDTVKADYLKAADKTALTTLITTAQNAADAAQADVDALETKVGTVTTGKTVVQMIADAQSAATYDDTALAARVTTNEGAIDTIEGQISTLNGSDSGKSVRTIANEELAAQLIAEGADASLDTLEEIAAWIQSHPDDASAMNAAITALQNQMSGISSGTGTVKKYVDDAITALNVGQYALAADLTALAARVSTLEGEMDGLATIASTGNVNDLVQTSGDVLVFDCGSSAI